MQYFKFADAFRVYCLKTLIRAAILAETWSNPKDGSTNRFRPTHTENKPFFFFFSFAFVVHRIDLCHMEDRHLSFLQLNGKGAKAKRRPSALQIHFDTWNICSTGERRMPSSADDEWSKFISVRSLISPTKCRQRSLRTSFFFALQSSSSTSDRCSGT